jgi:transposase
MKRAPRQKYTLEFKLEAVRLVKGGMRPAEAARQLGITEATLLNWRNAERDGKLVPGSAPKVTPEQMELSRMRAELARLKIENQILRKAAAYFAKESL